MVCDFCSHEAPEHHPLCPMTFILLDEYRKIAYDMGVGVATSDWADAVTVEARKHCDDDRMLDTRQLRIDSMVLYHRWVERDTERRYTERHVRADELAH